MTSPSEHMREALSLAKKGLLTTRPNPMVGCVITLDNKIIGRGWDVQTFDNLVDNVCQAKETYLSNTVRGV